MKILLINVPSRKGEAGFMLPLGLLYVGSIIERAGHSVKIFDPYLGDVELDHFNHKKTHEKIDEIIGEYKPSIIGFGGIATSYGRAKQLSLHIKRNHPKIMQIAGGPLASVYELLLTKTRVDVVFHGETEVSLPLFLNKIEKGDKIFDISGISHRREGRVIRNPPAEQIQNLDTIPFPAYHLIDLPKYFKPVKERIGSYKLLLETEQHYNDIINKIGEKNHYINIVTSRGCTNECLFCYRHVKGIRRHSVEYVIDHIKFLQKTYGVDGFYFNEELFNSSYEWVMELCNAIEKNNLDIFYIAGGARADKIDEKMLTRLKETGCIEIHYGQESGSDTILREYRKGITAQKNMEITILTRKVGLPTTVQIVIGSPAETNETIDETIQFLKDVNAYQYSINYLIPLPETPIWKYVEEKKLIGDVERYIDLVAECGGAPVLNLTDQPDLVWRNWKRKIFKEMTLHYHRKRRPKTYYIYSILLTLQDMVPTQILEIIPKSFKMAVERRLK